MKGGLEGVTQVGELEVRMNGGGTLALLLIYPRTGPDLCISPDKIRISWADDPL